MATLALALPPGFALDVVAARPMVATAASATNGTLQPIARRALNSVRCLNRIVPPHSSSSPSAGDRGAVESCALGDQVDTIRFLWTTVKLMVAIEMTEVMMVAEWRRGCVAPDSERRAQHDHAVACVR